MARRKRPAVQVEKSGGRVRLRGIRVPVPVTLDTEKEGRIHVVIQPNVWTPVPELVYKFLVSKFDVERYTMVPDVEANEANPHAPGARGAMTQEPVDPGFFMEFKQ